MAAAAVFILKVPCLYDMVPPRFAGPTIFNASTTYFERAKAYIAAADEWVARLRVLLACRRTDAEPRAARTKASSGASSTRTST